MMDNIKLPIILRAIFVHMLKPVYFGLRLRGKGSFGDNVF
jgi:hypothetical protein